MADRPFAYSIHPDDTIASVSDAWLEFADENRAPELTRDHVVGRSLWSFVAGAETRTLYEALFHRVRTRAESFDLPFRCDSPDRYRFMRLVLKRGPGGSVDCEGILVRDQARPFYSILDRAFPRSTARLPMCSLCKRLYALESQWLELEVAIERMDLFDTASLPELEYTVCDDCRSSVRRTSGSGAAA